MKTLVSLFVCFLWLFLVTDTFKVTRREPVNSFEQMDGEDRTLIVMFS